MDIVKKGGEIISFEQRSLVSQRLERITIAVVFKSHKGICCLGAVNGVQIIYLLQIKAVSDTV